MNITLDRFCHNEFGTFGKLCIGPHKFYTVEQDWENNKPNLSCVPNGTYNLRYFNSERHGATYIMSNGDLGVSEFKGQAKRFGCLIHSANLASQLEGCIAPGLRLGFYRNQWSVSSSGDAMKIILSLLGEVDSHVLTIGSNFPHFKETM
jgi:hypothetical protein